MERFTRPLMERVRRAHHHRQGRPAATASLAAFGELGGAYLAIVGGAAALETTWIEAIEDVDMDDLNPESLWRFRDPRLRPAAGGHGQPRRQPVRRRSTPTRAASARRRSQRSASTPRGTLNAAVQTDILILGSGGAGLFAALHAHARRSVAVDHHRGQGPARQMRLHAHGAGRLQRRACRRRFGRAAFHGHDRRRQVAARPGSRLDAGQRARSSASTSWKTSSAASSTAIPTAPCTRRRSPARPSTAPCTRAT